MKIKLYDSYATFGQSFIMLIFLPLNVLIWSIVIRTNISFPKIIFTLAVLSISMAIVFLSLKIADVYVENGKFLIQTIFKRTRKNVNEFRKITISSPFGFCLEFKDNTKVYILFRPDDLLKNFTGLGDHRSMIDSITRVIDQELVKHP